jgi:tryptophan-rich sensory protein
MTPTRTVSPVVAVGMTVAAVLAMNGVIFGLGWNRSRPISAAPLPPGWAIGAIWVGLFVLFALAWTRTQGVDRWAGRAILGFVTLCLAYPLYTGGLGSRTVGAVANVFCLMAALALVAFLWRRERGAALLFTPSLLWLGYASWAGLQGL